MIDAKQGIKPFKVIKVPRELYSKNHVCYCFQLKIIVFCSSEFSTSLSFLEQKTSEAFSLLALLFSLSLPSCFPVSFSRCTPTPSRSFEQPPYLIINLTPSLKMVIYWESWHLLSISSLYLKESLSQIICNHKKTRDNPGPDPSNYIPHLFSSLNIWYTCIRLC